MNKSGISKSVARRVAIQMAEDRLASLLDVFEHGPRESEMAPPFATELIRGGWLEDSDGSVFLTPKGRSLCEQLPRRPEVVRVDRAALVAAAETIRKHEKLLIAAFDDQHNQNMKPNEAPGYEVIYGTMRALAHVIHDDFRSSETRGGS